MPDIIIESRDGRRRRARKGEVIAEGESIRFPLTIMDAQSGEVRDALAAKYGLMDSFSPVFTDGTPDFTSPHRPGYRFADTNDPDRRAAEQAYVERSQRMEDGWCRKDEPKDAAPRPRTLDAARQQADAAYQARSQRLSNLWRDRNRV